MRTDFADHRHHLVRVIAAVRRATDPFELVRAASPPEETWGVLSIGKAAPAMDAAAPAGPLSRRLVVTTAGTELWGSPDAAELVDHPLPTERNVRATERATRWIDLAKSLRRGEDEWSSLEGLDPVLVAEALEGIDRESLPITLMISGGASACLASPMPGLSLADLRAITDALLRAGATIWELNTVRRHLELLKGGRLAAHAHPVPIRAFILSDVVGDDWPTVGSGPAAPDPTTFDDAIAVLRRRNLLDAVPGVARFLELGREGAIPETVKPGDTRLAEVERVLIGNVDTAARAAAAELDSIGIKVVSTRTIRAGEASEVGRDLAAELRALARVPVDAPRAVVLAGETTVRVGAALGRGGRNQELALAAAVALAGVPRVAVLTFATDGIDGPTDAAGAIVSGETASAATAAGIDLASALVRHDAYPALDALSCLIRTGPTGTNVNDIAVGIAY